MKMITRILGWSLFLAAVACCILYFYILLAVDSDEKLQRGTLWGELLLRSPVIREFPVDLIEGRKIYFYGPGGPNQNSSNSLLIEVQKYEPEMMLKCEQWFLANGFRRERSNTAHTLVAMTSNDGKDALIEVIENDIIITAEHK